MYCSSIGVLRDFLIKKCISRSLSDKNVSQDYIFEFWCKGGGSFTWLDSKEVSVKGLKHFGNKKDHGLIRSNVNNDNYTDVLLDENEFFTNGNWLIANMQCIAHSVFSLLIKITDWFKLIQNVGSIILYSSYIVYVLVW